MSEFEAYVEKRQTDKRDTQDVLKEFREIDLDDDGYIQFLEFFRAICNKKKIYLPAEINVFDQLQIYEIMEWRHITQKDKQILLKQLSDMQNNIDTGYSGRTTMKNFALGAIVAGVAATLAFKFGK